jgi:hypothetical protein
MEVLILKEFAVWAGAGDRVVVEPVGLSVCARGGADGLGCAVGGLVCGGCWAEGLGQGGAEIAGGEVAAGEEVGQLVAEFLCGEGLGFFLGVVVAEMGMGGDARYAAAAAIGKGEQTQGYAGVFTERSHGSLLRLSLLDLLG